MNRKKKLHDKKRREETHCYVNSHCDNQTNSMSRYFMTMQEATERKWKQNTKFNSKKNQHKGIELKKKSYMKKKTIPLFSFKSCHKIFFFVGWPGALGPTTLTRSCRSDFHVV